MDIVIVQWLYECGGLGELQEQCHEYRSKPLEVWSFLIPVLPFAVTLNS